MVEKIEEADKQLIFGNPKSGRILNSDISYSLNGILIFDWHCILLSCAKERHRNR
jgi:hypothetical protein